jgi:hypothetical protein
MVDSRDTYIAMIQQMMQAKHEILVTGWWITPDLPMVREEEIAAKLKNLFTNDNDDSASTPKNEKGEEALILLKDVIRNRAEHGVECFIQVSSFATA